jgi:hypothetical protein
MNGLLICL